MAAALYIDLNEIRAGMAATPEQSLHTSAYRRIVRRMRREMAELGETSDEVAALDDPADWLCPVDENACEVLLGPANVASVEASRGLFEATKEQASDQKIASVVNRADVRKRWRHGFLPMTIDEYLTVLDWTARQVAPGKSGAMDASLPPILERLKLSPLLLVQMISNFDKWFSTAVGSVQRLIDEAARRGRKWLSGVGAMRTAKT